ncbi:unnamed protein product, partial [Meganyctiphanes norvegica]
MEAHGIVPDVVDSVPKEKIEVKFGDVEAAFGNVLTPTQVQNPPTTLSWPIEDGAVYTLCKTAQVVFARADPKFNVLKGFPHKLVLAIQEIALQTSASLGYRYLLSLKQDGSSLHRYIYLAYKQPGKLTCDEPRLTNTNGDNRGCFSIRKFAEKYSLELVAGNLYQAEYDDYCEKLYQQLDGK